MRYLPLTDADRGEMLAAIGESSIDALFEDVPLEARLSAPIEGLPRVQGELEVERHLAGLAGRNIAAGDAPFFCGAGAYRHHIPATVDHLIQRSEFLTAYTPYQPEIAQGTLQTLFEFQTQVALITGMGVANASMYDGSTACAEAVLMACRMTGRNKVVLHGGLHPHYRDVVRTLADSLGVEVIAPAPKLAGGGEPKDLIDDGVACVVVQSPDVFGEAHDLSPYAETAHAAGALLVAVNTEVVSLGLLTPPGEMGADIVAAEGQSIGVGLNFGGPYVGLLAARDERPYLRQMPGRLCGETVDAQGERGFVLTLSTREQHIRRGKATSNICTNSGLCALAWTMHMTLLGDKGFERLAQLNHERAVETYEALGDVAGLSRINSVFFNEFAVRLEKPAAEVVAALAARGVLAGVPYSRLDPKAGLDDVLLIAATETVAPSDVTALVDGLRAIL